MATRSRELGVKTVRQPASASESRTYEAPKLTWEGSSRDEAAESAAWCEAEKRSQRVKDLVLGPLLVVGGIVVGVLMYSTLRQAVAATGSLLKTLAMTTFVTKLLLVAPVVATIVGAHKILRGLGLLKR